MFVACDNCQDGISTERKYGCSRIGGERVFAEAGNARGCYAGIPKDIECQIGLDREDVSRWLRESALKIRHLQRDLDRVIAERNVLASENTKLQKEVDEWERAHKQANEEWREMTSEIRNFFDKHLAGHDFNSRS